MAATLLAWCLAALDVALFAVALGAFIAVICAVFAFCTLLIDRITGWY